MNCAALVAACNTTTDTAATAAPTAAAPLVGKTRVAGTTQFIFNAGGTVGGVFKDQPIAGTYTASTTEVCSTYTSPAGFVDLGEICSVPVVSGNTVQFNRRDGSQSAVYTIDG